MMCPRKLMLRRDIIVGVVHCLSRSVFHTLQLSCLVLSCLLYSCFFTSCLVLPCLVLCCLAVLSSLILVNALHREHSQESTRILGLNNITQGKATQDKGRQPRAKYHLFHGLKILFSFIKRYFQKYVLIKLKVSFECIFKFY